MPNKEGGNRVKAGKVAGEDPERAEEIEGGGPEVKASEAHLELMQLFTEEADFKRCKRLF